MLGSTGKGNKGKVVLTAWEGRKDEVPAGSLRLTTGEPTRKRQQKQAGMCIVKDADGTIIRVEGAIPRLRKARHPGPNRAQREELRLQQVDATYQKLVQRMHFGEE